MNPRMRRTNGAGQRLESRSPLRNVADRAVGDDAEASEGLVYIALYLAPERTEANVGTIDVLDYRDARSPAGAHIFVISDATPRLLIGGQLGLEHRADRHGSRITDHRRQIRKRTDQRLGRVADQAALGRDHF